MAEPLTMTPEREAWYRSPEGIACAPLYTPDLLAELDATRAKLTEAESRVAVLEEEVSVLLGAQFEMRQALLFALDHITRPWESAVLDAQQRIRDALSPSQDAKGGPR